MQCAADLNCHLSAGAKIAYERGLKSGRSDMRTSLAILAPGHIIDSLSREMMFDGMKQRQHEFRSVIGMMIEMKRRTGAFQFLKVKFV